MHRGRREHDRKGNGDAVIVDFEHDAIRIVVRLRQADLMELQSAADSIDANIAALTVSSTQ
jgi:hypothetical protein